MVEPIHIHLGAEYQLLANAETVPARVRRILPQPLQHQLDTVAALADSDMVINAFPTGTGKTKAALLWLLDHPQISTLLIAPVNELVRQHAKDAQQFISSAGLPHAVAAVDAAYLRQLPLDPQRPGERFYRILTNPSLLPEAQNRPGNTKSPLLLVTNPDLFYYAVFYLFNHLDRRNIAEQFVSKFQYVVIDEVHYYDAKQFANLLFFVLLSKAFGYFDPDLPERRKICLLTATPDLDLNIFIERLDDEGISVKRLDPEPIAATDPHATKSLTELELELYPYNTRDAAGEFFAYVDRIAELVGQKKDGAILLNSLYGVNRLARVFERKLGVQNVGRITGPLSKEERKDAPFKPLLLATPTVDIGFNFEGHSKDRQNLDFVGFEAPLEDQFWQRLGRSGRVLGKPMRDAPSFAFAFIPDGAWQRLHEKLGGRDTLSRVELKSLLREAAEGEMRRASFAEYVKSYALLEVTQPLAEMERLLGESGAVIEQAFEMIRRVYAPSSKRQLWSLKGEIRRYQGFRRLLEELRKSDMKPDSAMIKALREYAQEEGGQTFSEGQIRDMTGQVLSSPGARAKLQSYVAREVAALQPVFSFRDANIGVEVEADDPRGLVSPARETVLLDLFHLLRFYEWRLKDQEQGKQTDLHVTLLDILAKPLEVGWRYYFDGDWEDFRRRYMKKPTALQGLNVSLAVQGSLISISPRIIQAVAQKYVPCLILDPNDLKPWQWGSLIRDGIYPVNLKATFTGAVEKQLYLLSGLDGYRVMGRYGWAIQRETGEWWVV